MLNRRAHLRSPVVIEAAMAMKPAKPVPKIVASVPRVVAMAHVGTERRAERVRLIVANVTPAGMVDVTRRRGVQIAPKIVAVVIVVAMDNVRKAKIVGPAPWTVGAARPAEMVAAPCPRTAPTVPMTVVVV